MRTLQPAQRIRRWHTYLAVWAVHRALGLSLALLLLLLSLSGALLVVHHDLERWWGSPYLLPPAETTGPAASWNDLLLEAAALAPEGHRAFRLLLPPAPDEAAKLLFLAPDGRTRWTAFADPRSRKIHWSGADQSLFTPWLLALHMHLHLGPWGYAVTGAAGAGLLALGLTGIYLHRNDLLALRRRPPLRWGRGWRAFLHDLHTWTGALSLYFSIVLGATGLAFAILILPGQLKPRPADRPAFDLSRLAPIDPMLTEARNMMPGQELLRVTLPADGQAPVRILLLDRRAPVWAKFSSVDFEPATGELLRWRAGREASTREKWRALVGPLHFGFYGAGWVKAAYVLGGLAPGVLAVTGAGLWWRRWRRQTRSSTPSRTVTNRPAAEAAGRGSGQKVNR